MKSISDVTLPFDLEKFSKVVDLIELDGPLLSLYQHENGDFYIFYWVDCDNHCNRWMVVRVGLNDVLRYIRQETSLRDLIEHTADNFVRIIDLDNEMKLASKPCLSTINDIPEQYLPEKNSFYEFGRIEDITKRVATTTIEVSLPERDKGFLSSLITRMGWNISVETLKELSKKTAAL